MRSIDRGDLTIGEVASVFSTIFGRPVSEFVLLVTCPHECGSDDCDGDQAMISSRSDEGTGHDEPFVLHMLGKAIEAIARAQAEQGPSHG